MGLKVNKSIKISYVEIFFLFQNFTATKIEKNGTPQIFTIIVLKMECC